MALADDREEFTLDDLATEYGVGLEMVWDEQDKKAKKRRISKIKRTHRIRTKRAERESELERQFEYPEPGESIHWISRGDIDSLSYFRILVKKLKPKYALISTWVIGKRDVLDIEEMLSSGELKSLDLIMGEIFRKSYPVEWGLIEGVFRKHNPGRLDTKTNHSKVMLLDGGSDKIVVESSANVNTNPRIEQTAIHNSEELYNFYKNFYDSL